MLFFYSATLAFLVAGRGVPAPVVGVRCSIPACQARLEEEILAKAKEQSHLMETVRAATTLKLQGRETERESRGAIVMPKRSMPALSVGKYQIIHEFRASCDHRPADRHRDLISARA